MNEYSPLMIVAVVGVAFIAGYAVVSYVLGKLKRSNPPGASPSSPVASDQESNRQKRERNDL
jgi:hypothetical protein